VAGGAAGDGASSVGAGGRGGAVAGGDAIGAYLREVRSRLQARLVFPASARELGLHGTVTVRFAIEADGSLGRGSLAIETSSGSPILDRAAMETVDRAAPFPKPVSGSCAIRSPVVFTLQP
jgi:protein TonB